mmetsp:Transcript_27330/g.57245  ORF Transcript_27330/g.57245 Transcript_27330/m.57245 type:complete len:92 (+) Transcript_27330:62-337(+)
MFIHKMLVASGNNVSFFLRDVNVVAFVVRLRLVLSVVLKHSAVPSFIYDAFRGGLGACGRPVTPGGGGASLASGYPLGRPNRVDRELGLRI